MLEMFSRASSALAAVLLATALISATARPCPANGAFKRVILFSVDGLHASDLTYITTKLLPNGHLAKLAAMGTTFPLNTIDGITDSFPGMSALATGGTSRSHGVFYDDVWVNDLWAAGTNCTNGRPVGKPGCEVQQAENLDRDLNRLDGGGDSSVGSIDPSLLPLDAHCKPVYPHNFIRVNTIFEVVKAAGMHTAWADKHPAYDLLNGPSGKGIQDFYAPEINCVCGGPSKNGDYTKNYTLTPEYDTFHLQAVLNWIHGKAWNGQSKKGFNIPGLMGCNFQTVSVAEKYAGYDNNGMPTAGMDAAFMFIDDSMGKVMAALTAQGLMDTTAIIVTAKHGQSPIRRNELKLTADNIIPGVLAAAGIKVAFQTADDVSLLWLEDKTQAEAAAAVLQLAANNASAGTSIATIYQGESLMLAGFNDPRKDMRVPDVIVQPLRGTIYVGKPATATKIAEHGGMSPDDQDVALLVAGKGLMAGANMAMVHTKQVAPTVLMLLGLDPMALQAAKMEDTMPLPLSFK